MKSKTNRGERPLGYIGSGLLIMAVLATPLAGCKENAAVDLSPDWIVGHWCGSLDGISVEELWRPPEDGVYIGVGRTRDSGKNSIEYLRIEDIDGVQNYIAQPAGQPSTPFKRTAGGESWVRFENPDHDFPQRIEYRREGDMLHAEIAGPNKDGEPKEFLFKFSACGA
ncbi:MAG: hypothetical protein GWP58_09540 [Gammaproteobacteria bacterium]|jgi:hypothetical protein|nr:hypothetical protein [Gammaproteobacteria bacterium]